MVHLLSVHDAFHARVIAARLGSDGIVTELRGAVGGPYPLLGEVGLYVGEGDVATARQLLLADHVESAFDDGDPLEDDQPAPRSRRAASARACVAVAAAFLLAFTCLTWRL